MVSKGQWCRLMDGAVARRNYAFKFVLNDLCVIFLHLTLNLYTLRCRLFSLLSHD